MIHVFLDTNIYRDNPARNSIPFRALSHLAANELITIYLPYVVEKEFLSQQRKLYADAIGNIHSELSDLKRKSISATALAGVEGLNTRLYAIEEDLLNHATRMFSEWIELAKVVRLPVGDSHGAQVLEDYFEGRPPFKQVKSRNDFPDAFIWQALAELLPRVDQLLVVTKDKPLKEAYDRHEKVECFESIQDLLLSPECKPILEGEFEHINFPELLIRLESNKDVFADALKEMLPDAISRSVVKSYSIPDDNHEGTITMVHEPESVYLQFHQAARLSSNVLTVPFSLNVEALLDYAIYKADYYGLDEDKSANISISELNDHYYEAEEDYLLLVSGNLAIEFDASRIASLSLTSEEVDEVLQNASVTIDQIDEISIDENEF